MQLTASGFIKKNFTFNKISHLCPFLALLLLMISVATGFASDLSKDLDRALRAGNAAKVSEILNKGGSSLRDTVKSSASYYLPHCARFGTAELVEMFIKKCNLVQEKRAIDDALITSIDNDNFASIVPLLLKYGADPNHEMSGMAALSRVAMLYAGKQAVSKQTVATARLLLKKGAYVDRFDEYGETPLMAACSKGDIALIELLLANGANPELSNKDCRSAMSYAKPGTAVAAALTAKVAGKGEPASDMPQNQGQSLFGTPAASQEKYLNSIGFDSYMENLMTLSTAVSAGDAKTVKEILAAGLDANSLVDDSGITFLMQAANAEIAEILLNAGADARKADSRGWTVLHHAATREADAAMITMLIRAGTSVNQLNSDGETPLRLTGILFTEKIAPAWGESLISLLVAAGADINATDKEGHTLLHQAAFNDNSALARTCISMGGNPDIKTKAGKTPRQIAIELDSQACLKVFAQK